MIKIIYYTNDKMEKKFCYSLNVKLLDGTNYIFVRNYSTSEESLLCRLSDLVSVYLA